MRPRLACLLILSSFTTMVSGSPVLAGGGDQCSILPSRVSAVIDPALFDAGELPDVENEITQALFRPSALVLDTTSPGSLWARFSLTIRGTTYRDTVGFPTPMFFPYPSGLYPSAFGWSSAFFGSFQYLFADVTKPFPGVYTFESLQNDFMDPRSYPITIEVTYAADSQGEEMCSLIFEFDVSKGRRGFEFDLDQYLHRAIGDANNLPDTL